jgi:hypothetical protein
MVCFADIAKLFRRQPKRIPKEKFEFLEQALTHAHPFDCDCTDLNQPCSQHCDTDGIRSTIDYSLPRLPQAQSFAVHAWDCECTDLRESCVNTTETEQIRAALETEMQRQAADTCDSPICTCITAGGPKACLLIADHFRARQSKYGATYDRSFFSGSPQEHAVLNRHLVDYFNGLNRAKETTPYNVPQSQRHLLPALGMEMPNPDAPETPHALHKCIEESQLKRLRRILPENEYGIVSVKSSKLHLLPTAGSVQNPVFEAKDISRYPGTAVKHATFEHHDLHLLEDVSSVVTPHELVEKLAKENPTGHLIVTGMNPIEVLDGARSFEPSSHLIEYDMGSLNFIFTDSES